MDNLEPKPAHGKGDKGKKRFNVSASPSALMLSELGGDLTTAWLRWHIEWWWTERPTVGLTRDGRRWIAFSMEQWMANTGLSRQQVKRSMRLLKERKFIATKSDKVTRKQRYFTTFVCVLDASHSGAGDTASEIHSGSADTASPLHSGPGDPAYGVHSGSGDTPTIGTDEESTGTDDGMGDAMLRIAPPACGEDKQGKKQDGKDEAVAIGTDKAEDARVQLIALKPMPEQEAEFWRWAETDPHEACRHAEADDQRMLKAEAWRGAEMHEAWKWAHAEVGMTCCDWLPRSKEYAQAKQLQAAWGPNATEVLWRCVTEWDHFAQFVKPYSRNLDVTGFSKQPTLGTLLQFRDQALQYAVRRAAGDACYSQPNGAWEKDTSRRRLGGRREHDDYREQREPEYDPDEFEGKV